MEITKMELVQKPFQMPNEMTSFRNYFAVEVEGNRIELPLEPMITTDEYVKIVSEFLEKLKAISSEVEVSNVAIKE